jgi:phage FluMu protein Com
MESEESLKMELSLKCPVCGSNLQLIENSAYVMLGCPKCRKYTRMTKKHIYRVYIEYDGNLIHLKWAELIKELYTRIATRYYLESDES